MKTVGIIAEFNPFHNGHKYLIEQAKEITGADCCVVIMSGDFVQRGAPALCNKYLRTEMALKAGADIVFELPAVYALGSAEMFAEGAVSLLSATGQIDYLCFGSECGDTEKLIKCASVIEEYTVTPEFKEQLSNYIKNGASYPSAFSNALSNALGSLQSLLCTPNNLLGIEYIRALIRAKNKFDPPCSNVSLLSTNEIVTENNIIFRFPIPITINRVGSDHFDSIIKEYSSATAIRNHITDVYKRYKYQTETGKDNLEILADSLPENSNKLIIDNFAHLLPIIEDDFSSMLYMRLNTILNDELFAIPDINPDLIHKLMDFKGKRINILELIMSLKSKCFTYTSISRTLFRVLLCPAYSKAISSLLCHNNTNDNKPYLRLLGFNKKSSGFLRDLRYSEQIDIITKPADGPLSDPVYNLDLYAANLYEQVCSDKFKSQFTEEIKAGPVIL